MVIGDMVIYRLIFYVKQVEEENLRNREENINKKYKIRNESEQKKGGSNQPQFLKQKGHTPSSISAHTLKGEYNGRIHNTSSLYKLSPSHKEVIGFLHLVGVLETISVSVVIASQVASSAVKRFT